MNRLTIGTRGSKLALYQADLVKKNIRFFFPDIQINTKIIKTKGDVFLEKDLTKVLEKGFFTSEIQDALYSKEIDLAVHSLKDLPTEMPKDSCIAAILSREDYRDVFLSTHKTPLSYFNEQNEIS